MDFKEKLKNLKSIFGVFNNRELAEKLGITEDAIKGWAKRKTVPEKYEIYLNKNNIKSNIGNSSVQINGNNHGHININSSDEMSMEICKCIKKLSEKKKEYFYHLIKAELLKEEN